MITRKSNVKTNFKDPKISGFLGIGEGKIAAAKAAGEVAIEQARQDTLTLEALLATKGYDPAADAAKAAEAAAAADSAKSKYTVYIAIGVVLILMVGLFFIVKARRRAV